MPMMRADRSVLLAIDFQQRLVPAIHQGAAAVANARRLLDAAALLGVPVLATEQTPDKLGPTLPELAAEGARVLQKTTFDALATPAIRAALAGEAELVVTGCEAHVCVLQTVLSLRAAGRQVFVVEDAIGSRRAESHAAARRRMAAEGATIVTTEMVVFEWLGCSTHPRFREVVALIK